MENAATTPEPARPNTAASVGGTVAAVGAALAGRFLGWAFGLRFLLPLIVALVVLSVMRKRLAPAMQSIAPALAAHAAMLTWGLLEVLLNSIQYGFHFSPTWALLLLISIGGLVWGISQPGIGPVGLLLARDGYSLLMSVSGIPMFFKGSASLVILIPYVVTLALGICAVCFLAMSVKSLQATSSAA